MRQEYYSIVEERMGQALEFIRLIGVDVGKINSLKQQIVHFNIYQLINLNKYLKNYKIYLECLYLICEKINKLIVILNSKPITDLIQYQINVSKDFRKALIDLMLNTTFNTTHAFSSLLTIEAPFSGEIQFPVKEAAFEYYLGLREQKIDGYTKEAVRTGHNVTRPGPTMNTYEEFVEGLRKASDPTTVQGTEDRNLENREKKVIEQFSLN